MAYVNLEAEKVDFRVVFGAHSFKTQSSQIQSHCTGILIEGLFFDPMQFSQAVKGRLSRQYQAIKQVAQERRIPLVAAESVWREEKMPRPSLLTPEHIILSPVLHMRLVLGLHLGLSKTEITRDSLFFRFLDGLYSNGEWLPRQSLTLRLRNLIMAQKADTFATVQIKHGMDRPNLVLVAGGEHTGLVRALEMEPEQRTEMILKDRRVSQYFQPGLFHIGYYAQINRSKKRWDVYKFEEPRLRIA